MAVANAVDMRFHMVTNVRTGKTNVEPMAATTDEEARAELFALMDDCPECQLARARGEAPTVVDVPPPRPRGTERFRRPRWRELRRRIPRR